MPHKTEKAPTEVGTLLISYGASGVTRTCYRRIDVEKFYATLTIFVYVREHANSGGRDVLKLGTIDFYAVKIFGADMLSTLPRKVSRKIPFSRV